MHRSDDVLSQAMLDLAAFINDPRQDWRMMAEAGLDLDPAFLPLLVRLGARGPSSVVELADELGRDHSTMSRQLGRLEAAGLVARAASPTDGRVRIASVTAKGQAAVAALSAARRAPAGSGSGRLARRRPRGLGEAAGAFHRLREGDREAVARSLR